MTKFIECPVCGSKNKDSETHCKKCGYELNFQEASPKKPSDWLNELRTTSDQSLDSEGQKYLSDNNPDFQELDSETPDWLSRIRDRKEIDDEYQKFSEQINQQVEKKHNPDQPEDYLNILRDNSEKNNEINSEASDLISNFRDENNNVFFNPDQDSEKQSSDDESELSGVTIDQKEWLQRLPATGEQKEPNENKSDIPDWIQNSNTLQSNEDLITDEKKDEELPDWISKFDSFDDDAEGQDQQPDQIPDWVQFSGNQDLETEESEKDKKETIPEWISPTISPTEDKTTELSNTDELGDQENFQIEKGEEFLSEQTISAQESQVEEFNFDDFPISDLPSSPQQQNNESLTSESNTFNDEDSSFKNPFISDIEPEWIGDFSSTEDTPDIEKEEKEEEEENTGPFIKSTAEISPGELPGWLKAMRPIEAVIPDINLKGKRRRIEKSGPLSGLSGVLSSEEIVKKYSAPPSYSVKLELSEKQKINAELLDQVFTSAQFVEKPISQSSRNTDTFLRLFLSLFLLIVLIFPIFYEFPLNTIPDIIPEETVRFASISNGLLLSQESSPHVLIIMDNEAASQAEISLVTQSVFERLMIKDSYLSIISSNPNANLVATEVLNRANLTIPTYKLIDRVSNFGFLPGDTTGIQSFLANPRRSVPVGIFPEDIWNSPGLKDLDKISEFDSIILVTDNPENSKLWLEQIRLNIPEMPVLVASTAQASPLLQPYVDSNQIDGMISGLYGSIKYSELIQKESPSLVSYWNHYRLGIFAFIIIIVVGGIYRVISQIFIATKTKAR